MHTSIHHPITLCISSPLDQYRPAGWEGPTTGDLEEANSYWMPGVRFTVRCLVAMETLPSCY